MHMHLKTNFEAVRRFGSRLDSVVKLFNQQCNNAVEIWKREMFPNEPPVCEGCRKGFCCYQPVMVSFMEGLVIAYNSFKTFPVETLLNVMEQGREQYELLRKVGYPEILMEAGSIEEFTLKVDKATGDWCDRNIRCAFLNADNECIIRPMCPVSCLSYYHVTKCGDDKPKSGELTAMVDNERLVGLTVLESNKALSWLLGKEVFLFPAPLGMAIYDAYIFLVTGNVL